MSVSVAGELTVLLGGERETSDYTCKLFDDPLTLNCKNGWTTGELPRMHTARTALAVCAGKFWPACRRCQV